jgi:hypothetical protein
MAQTHGKALWVEVELPNGRKYRIKPEDEVFWSIKKPPEREFHQEAGADRALKTHQCTSCRKYFTYFPEERHNKICEECIEAGGDKNWMNCLAD